MPGRDIRSYFIRGANSKETSSATTSKPKKRRIISSDEDDVKLQSPVKRTKKTKRLDKPSISSDSDKESEKDKPIVSSADLFGKKPISRKEAPKINKLVKEEAKVHNDDDFEATLIQLDTSEIENKYLAEDKPGKASDRKNEKVPEKHQTSKRSEEKKKTPVKDEEPEKHNVEKKKTPDKKKAGSSSPEKKRQKKSSGSSIEDVERNEVGRSKTKLKNGSQSSKSKTGITKMEYKVEYKEPKKKTSPKKSDELDVYEERIEKKKHRAALYQQYLQRGGARNPGSKEVPVGQEYCLAGLSFVITGVLDSLEKEEADELIKKYGGRVLHQVSKKTDYVVVGDQPGPAKLSKAESLNIKQISEDDLLELIRTRPAGKADNVIQPHSRSKEKSKQKSVESEVSPSPPKISKTAVKEESPKRSKSRSPQKKESTAEVKKVLFEDKSKTVEREVKIKTEDTTTDVETQALVDKYRPKTMKQILGQQGDKSNAKKLYTWLMNWHKNHGGNVKHTKPSPWAKNDDGAFFKAALLSGPPGIGKTTTVQVVCEELGFDLIEFNASDTRSKRLLQEEVSELLSNTTLKDYFIDNTKKPSAKHVLLMDEVDGMAGNEDRGGLQELIALIKSTDVPIVCICNDRNNPKMRTLANYTFDLRFPKPRLEQIRGAMKSICFKEKINISTEDLDRLIESTNQDIRQIINHLALFVGGTAHQEKSQRKHVNKDLKLGPWDVVRKVFSAEEHKSMSLRDKRDLFFHDYNIAPLFVQENYLLVSPSAPRNQLLERIAGTAESLALGDMIEKLIRSNNAWSLLPVQSCCSSVIPGSLMSGHITGQINFPAWLGRNSKTRKFDRLMQDLTVHTRLTTGANKEAINLDYLNHLRDAVIRPLAVSGTDGVDEAMNVMNYYHLLREDLDALVEVSLWPGKRDPMQAVDSKVKAAFTRAYNKHSVALPYSVSSTASSKKITQSSQDEGFLDDEEEEGNSDENEDNVDTDKMIKAKKPSTSKKTEAKAAKSSDKPTKRGRGRGKAK